MDSLESSKNVKVLMYHRVLKESPPKEAPWHYVTTGDFEKQMKWIDRLGYNTITFEDYQMYREGKLTLPKKSVIITFDDGYLDTFTEAIPIMLKYNMRGVIYVMGNRKMNQAEWENNESGLACHLMTDQQIIEANSMGFEIGAHSCNHHDLIKLTKEEARTEVSCSKENIESILGKKITSFAYPYGRVNEQIQSIVKNEGFYFGCGVYTGPPKFTENPFDIRRIEVDQTTGLSRFLLGLLTPLEYIFWSYNELKQMGNKENGTAQKKQINNKVLDQSHLTN